MTLQSSGPISLLDIQNEFGGSNPIGIDEYYGVDAGVPASGTISLSNFYGKSNTPFVSNIFGNTNTSGNYTGYQVYYPPNQITPTSSQVPRTFLVEISAFDSSTVTYWQNGSINITFTAQGNNYYSIRYSFGSAGLSMGFGSFIRDYDSLSTYASATVLWETAYGAPTTRYLYTHTHNYII